MVPTIDVINESTVLTESAEVAAVVAALQKQVDMDFDPVWNRGANLSLVTAAQSDRAAWQLVLLDDSDQADALGYHDLTAAGLPLGKVFVKTTMDDKLNWTITASHELLEMLGDPDINLCAEYSGPGNKSRFYAYEVCDACEDDSFAYEIDGVMVSDFVLPEWFMQTAQRDAYDFKGHITKPFQLLKGGYIGEYVPGKGWTQIDADVDPLNVPHPMTDYSIASMLPNTRSKQRLQKRSHHPDWRLSARPSSNGTEA